MAGELTSTPIRKALVTDRTPAGTTQKRTRERSGWYVYGEMQPWRRWALGFRYDWTQYPDNPGTEWAVSPTSPSCRRSSSASGSATSTPSARRRSGFRTAGAPGGRRAALPGHVHPGRPPGASLLRGDPHAPISACSSRTAPRRRPRGRRARGRRQAPRRHDHPRSQGADRGRRRRSRRGGLARPRQPEPTRPRGPPEPDGQGAPRRPARRSTALELRSVGRVVVAGANNPKVLPGTPGRVDVSDGLPLLERARPAASTARWATSIPSGNPHYTLDPGLAPPSPPTSSTGSSACHPSPARPSRRTGGGLPRATGPGDARWRDALAPVQGAQVVTYHAISCTSCRASASSRPARSRTGPGIPPSPAHLARLDPGDEGGADQASWSSSRGTTTSWPSAWRAGGGRAHGRARPLGGGGQGGEDVPRHRGLQRATPWPTALR